MTDTKSIVLKKELIVKLQKRVTAMKPGDEVKCAEFVFMALDSGFSYGVVRTFLESYRDLGVVDLGYRDGKIYIVKKPEGVRYDN